MKKIKRNKFIVYNLFISLLIIVLISFITYGFAHYEKLLTFSGIVTVIPDGELEITNISVTDSSNVINSEIPTFTDETINFYVTFSGTSDNYFITYSADIVNNSSYDYIYNDFALNPVVTSDGGAIGILSMQIEGIETGRVIKAKDTITIYVTLTLNVEDVNQIYNASGGIDVDTNVQDGGELLASVETITNNLQGNNELAEVKLSLINTYSRNIKFRVGSTNSNFYFADSNGNKLETLIIEANTTQDYQLYIKKSDNSYFSATEESTIMKLICENINNIVVGEINLLVDITTIIIEDKPVITSFDINGNSVSGSSAVIDISWTGHYNGEADSYVYNLSIYNTRTNEVKEVVLDSTTYTYQYTVNKAGNYYATIYGTASDGKSGKDYENVEDSPYYKKTAIVSYYSITIQFTNASWSGPSLVKEGDTFTGTLSTGSSYLIPNDMQVYMGDTLLSSGTNSDYWFTGRTAREGSFSLYTPATADLKLIMVADKSSSSGCLVKGTQILLANGKTKNIEDIDYNDLLMVWDYERGNITYQYPIWIEKPMNIDKYTKITFSDGSIINVAFDHAFYSYDINLFVTVSDTENFKIGTNVAKMNDNYKLEKVKVEKIEIVYEDTNYYHIVSTRYYNVIANNILTTDDVVFVSNLYGFSENAIWPEYRNIIINDKNNLYDYNEFDDFLPYYMFKGLRVEEAKVLENYISLDEFKQYLLSNQLNLNILKLPNKNINLKNIWMVTTSDDIVKEYNKNDFIIEEGKQYTLPEPVVKDKFLYWYNTSDGKKYNIGDKLEIWHGTHFVAIYDN